MGRRKITLTPEQVQHVEKLAPVLRLSDIADFLGITDNTLRARMREDPTIHAAYKRGKQKAISEIGNILLNKARGGNLTAIIFYLKTQGRWREVNRLEHVDVTDHLTDEQLEAIVRGEPISDDDS